MHLNHVIYAKNAPTWTCTVQSPIVGDKLNFLFLWTSGPLITSSEP